MAEKRDVWIGAMMAWVFLATTGGCSSTPRQVDAVAAGQPRVHDRWAKARRTASSAFWSHWGDGKAELSGYRVVTMRYGERREGEVVLVYVTEPLDGRTLIKDDDETVPKRHRLNVLKLNHMLRFQTGIYPYAVMTSVFAPVDDHGGLRFSPAKIAFSAQEWCGHVYQQIRPEGARLFSAIRSYFGSEGEKDTRLAISPNALYEDALLIQLRELDGPFADGGDWKGQLVPALWRSRKAHQPVAPVNATIKRREATVDGQAVTRFTVQFGQVQRTIDVEQARPRRVLGWRESGGEQAALLATTRLAYWKLNGRDGAAYRNQLGLTP